MPDHNSTVDYKRLGEMLTTMWSRNYHKMSSNRATSAIVLPQGQPNMAQFEEAFRRYRDDPVFRQLVASTVGSILAVVQECDKGGPEGAKPL